MTSSGRCLKGSWCFMKNKEKFMKEISEIELHGGIVTCNLAGDIANCLLIDCCECLFYWSSDCHFDVSCWLNEEYTDGRYFNNVNGESARL